MYEMNQIYKTHLHIIETERVIETADEIIRHLLTNTNMITNWLSVFEENSNTINYCYNNYHCNKIKTAIVFVSPRTMRERRIRKYAMIIIIIIIIS